MTGTAIGLVLLAALAHAGWNLLAKRASAGGAPFVWLYTGLEVVLWAPVAVGVLLLTESRPGALALALVAGSAVLHTAYFVLLQRGYARGDLSVVYPFARGVAPLLAVIAAVVVLGEDPAPVALAGAGAVGVGVVWIGWTARPGAQVRARLAAPVGYALATAVMIASYTVWDGFAMQTLALSPIVYHWAAGVVRMVLLTPMVARRGADVRSVWRESRGAVAGVAVLAPLAYILVLVALTLAPVSYVAPAREASIVIATALGVSVLGERGAARGGAGQRVGAAGLVAVGVALLGLA